MFIQIGSDSFENVTESKQNNRDRVDRFHFVCVCLFFFRVIYGNREHHLLTQPGVKRHSRSEREREVPSRYELCLSFYQWQSSWQRTHRTSKNNTPAYAWRTRPRSVYTPWIDFDFYLTTHKSKSTQRVLYFNKSKIVCKSIDDKRMGRVIRNKWWSQ